jgi:phosphatidylglycerophosphate synthase
LDKVPVTYRYYDISDYARPAALWAVQRLLPTPVTSLHVTLVFIAVGILAAALFAVGTYPAQVAGGLLLIVKSGIDAIDGSLARARNRPSRVGRFADTLGDVLVNTLVFAAIAYAEIRHGHPASAVVPLAVLALASMTWQSTVYNYFGVSYRFRAHGDTTSKLNESEADAYPWDNPAVLRALMALYHLLLSWQDALIVGLDRRLYGDTSGALVSRQFMTATTVMGLGTQLLIITIAALLGRPAAAFWVFVVPLNLYWIALLWLRSRAPRA